MKKLYFALLLACLHCTGLLAQNNGAPLVWSTPQFTNAAGTAPLALGFVCWYAAGTTTPQAPYQDNALGTPHHNPMQLNAAGRPVTWGGSTELSVYFDALSYKLVLYGPGSGNTCNGTTVGALIKTVDNQYDLAELIRGGLVTLTSVNNRQYCTSGANFGAKVTAAAALLPSTGGIIDCSNLQGAQSITGDPFTGISKPVRVIWPSGTTTSSVALVQPSTMEWDMPPQAILSSSSTTTMNGSMSGSLSQHFSGSGTVTMPNVKEVYPQWWGAAPSTTDNGPALNAAVAATGCAGKIVIPPGTYGFTTQWLIFQNATQCKITIEGAANFATKLNWNGATNAVAVVIEHAIRFILKDLEINNNSGALGTTIGLEIRSVNSGSDTGPAFISNVSLVGFNTCAQLGLSTNESVSELNFQNLEVISCGTGVVMDGNQTLNINFTHLLCASNTTCVDGKNVGQVLIESGSFSGDTTDITWRTAATHITVKHIRSENIVTRFFDLVTTGGGQPVWVDIEDCEMRPVAGTPTMIAGSSGSSLWNVRHNIIAGSFSPGTGALFVEFTGNGVAAGGSSGLPFTDNNETALRYTQYQNYLFTSTTDWTVAGRYNNSSGTVISSTKTDILMSNDNGILVNGGVNQAGTGIQHKRGSVGCTTGGAAIGDACTSSSINWTTAFPDTNYSLVCTLDGTSILNKPVIMYTTKSAGSFTITIAQLTASAATGNYDCVALHD